MTAALSQMYDRADAYSVEFFDLDNDQHINLEQAVETLAPDEHARMERFKFDIHRKRFARGRGFLRMTLGRHLGTDPAKLAFSYEDRGKPYLKGHPVHFNLSHSHAKAVLALSDAPIGIDLEFMDRKTDVMTLAPSVFVPNELNQLRNVEEKAQRQVFFAFWTAKEAYMKLTGAGLSLAPKSIELEIKQNRPCGVICPSIPKTRLAPVTTPDALYECTVAQVAN